MLFRSIGVVLAVIVFEAIKAGGIGEATTTALIGLLMTGAVGGLVGAGAALVLVQLLKRFLIPDYLHSAVFLAAAVAMFGMLIERWLFFAEAQHVQALYYGQR